MKKLLSNLKTKFTVSANFKALFTLCCCIAFSIGMLYTLIAGVNVLLESIKIENNIKKLELTPEGHTRSVYINRLESKFDVAREDLAVEVDKYIITVAPNSDIDALNLIDLCSKYNVDIRLVLAQGHLESHFGTLGTAARTNSVFNVGAFDGHSASKQIKNGYGYAHPDFSVEPYLILLTTRYLVDGRVEEDLLDNFVDKNGNRYASSTTYEAALKAKIDNMDTIADITNKYNVYKKYKLKLGR